MIRQLRYTARVKYTVRPISLLLLLLAALPAAPGCAGCFDVGPPGADAGIDGGVNDGPPVGVAINELMSQNLTSIVDSTGAHADWVELKNLDDSAAVDLEGYKFTDSATVPDKFVFPAGVSIAAGAYLVVFCDGDITQSTATEPHTPFRLTSSGEPLRLNAPDGSRADSTNFPALLDDQSFGRKPDGAGDFQILASATPRAAN